MIPWTVTETMTRVSQLRLKCTVFINQSRFSDEDSSETDDESDISELEDLKTLTLPSSNGVSIADVLQQAKVQNKHKVCCISISFVQKI